MTTRPTKRTLALAGLAASLLTTGLLGQTARYPIRHERKTMIPMRDGVRLATEIARPDSPGRFPVVLSRTPYSRGGNAALMDSLAAAGYGAVWQDVRGRFDSEGEWAPFVHEADDGYDTIQWAATQPWSNGTIAMFGGSYDAMVQWLAAKRKNPHLAGLISFVSPGDFYQDFFWEGGAFALGAAALWSTFTDGKGINLIDSLPWDRALEQLPLEKTVSLVGHHPPAFGQWIQHPTDDRYWQALSFDRDFPQFDFPVLHIGGWFDIFQKGTIENFRRMTTRARPAARSKQHLIVGPWGHQGQNASKVGDVDFGPQSALSMTPLVMQWLDRYIRGNASGPPLPAVRVFVMGENAWRDYPTWPVPSMQPVDYFLRSSGQANGSSGDGRLDPGRPPAAETADHYRYDPAHPVSTRGGGNCCWPKIVAWGPLDQRPVELRSDVLVYSTPPLEQPVRVVGPVRLELWIASTAPNTDFTGKLVDVAPDGFSMNLTDGIQRASHRRSDTAPRPLVPGQPTAITVDLWNTAHLFQPGHRIRLEVSSSNFPRYSRNLNTTELPEMSSRTAIANQTIYHDSARPSRLVLPVVREPAH